MKGGTQLRVVVKLALYVVYARRGGRLCHGEPGAAAAAARRRPGGRTPGTSSRGSASMIGGATHTRAGEAASRLNE